MGSATPNVRAELPAAAWRPGPAVQNERSMSSRSASRTCLRCLPRVGSQIATLEPPTPFLVKTKAGLPSRPSLQPAHQGTDPGQLLVHLFGRRAMEAAMAMGGWMASLQATPFGFGLIGPNARATTKESP